MTIGSSTAATVRRNDSRRPQRKTVRAVDDVDRRPKMHRISEQSAVVIGDRGRRNGTGSSDRSIAAVRDAAYGAGRTAMRRCAHDHSGARHAVRRGRAAVLP